MTLAVPPVDIILWACFTVIFFFLGVCGICCCCCKAERSWPGTHMLLRILRAFIVSGSSSFLLVVLIVGFLGLLGVPEKALYDPIMASTCSADCTYETRDGLDGWADEKCCTYLQNRNQRDVWLRTPTKAYTLHGWIMVNETLAFAGQQRLNILYNHGSGGNIAMGYRHVRYADLLAQGNVAIFAYDYAGFGRSSEVTPTVDIIMESAETAAVWFADWVRNPDMTTSAFGEEQVPIRVLIPTDGVDMSDIVFQGRSMGGWVSTWLGAKIARWRVKGLLMQSVLSSMGELWATYFPMAGWVLHGIALDATPQFDNPRYIEPFAGCLYQYQSKDDEWAPFENGKETNKAAINKRGSCSVFIEVTGVKHTQPLNDAGRSTLFAWLAAVRTEQPAPRRDTIPEQESAFTVAGAGIAGCIIALALMLLGSVVIAVFLTGIEKSTLAAEAAANDPMHPSPTPAAERDTAEAAVPVPRRAGMPAEED